MTQVAVLAATAAIVAAGFVGTATFLEFVLGCLAEDHGNAPLPETERAGGLGQGQPAHTGERVGPIGNDSNAKVSNGALFHTLGDNR